MATIHQWAELWLLSPPTGTDYWYVFDASDGTGTAFGTSDSRENYGAVWDPYSVVVPDSSESMNWIDVGSAY